MDLRDLHYFETIATLGHLGQAARALHRTQPALSSCIRRLEEDCGAPLFQRAGRGIALTEAGEVLLKWARRMRFDVEDARREIGELGQGLSGQVRIGIVPTAAQYLLPQAARQLLEEAPGVTLKTVVGLADELRPRLLDGELDLLVGTEGAAAPGFVTRQIAQDYIVVAASARHALFQGKPALADLCRYQWVLQPQGAPVRDWLDHAFDRCGLPRPRVQVESTMLILLPTLIAETDLLSFVSRYHLEPGAAGAPLREVPMRETTMRRRLVLTHREHSYLGPAAQRLIALMGQAVSRAPDRVVRRPSD